MKRWYGRHYCCHSLVTEHVGSNKRSVGCREIEFLLPGNKHHIIFIFVLLFLFFCFRKLTNKGTGPRDWRILFLYNYDNYSYITMTIICLFSAASLSRSFSLMRKNWPKKALVRVIGEGFCYYITMTTICFFLQMLLFLLWGKTDQKRRWSRRSGRGCVGRTPRHSGVSPERREKGRLCRIERNWRRYERQIKLHSKISSSDT